MPPRTGQAAARGASGILAGAGLVLALMIGAPAAATPAPLGDAGHYTMADFAQVEKIDAHVHIHGKAEAFMRQAQQDRVRILTINVEYGDFAPIDVQRDDALALEHAFPGRVAYAGTFSVKGFTEPGWIERAQAEIGETLADGAVAIKFWKNIGMELRDDTHRLVMIDDPRIRPLIDRLEQDGVVVLGHQGEPRNCWLAFDQMTVKGDAEYYREHPQYHMYEHPEYPSYEAQIAARDHMLQQHPRLKFVGLHLASLEWDVERIAAFLDRFPNAYVDLAARTIHLERQAVTRHDRVRAFLIRYQDRILYGTDIATQANDSSDASAKEAHEAWQDDWRFFNTGGAIKSDEFDGKFRGVELPRTVVDKIYRENARKLFPTAWR